MTHFIWCCLAAATTVVIGLRPGGTAFAPLPDGGPRSRSDESWRSRLRIIDMTGYPPLVEHHRAYGVENGLILGSWAYDANNDGLLDSRENFVRAFRKHVPPTFAGIVSLDWEGPITAWLKEPPNSANFQRAIATLRELLLLAKRVRPHARIGYYGLPLPNYWSRDEGWRARSLAMVELLKNADWVGPSVYMFYKTGERHTPERQHRYAFESTMMALEVAAAAGGKPVYQFVTHRYHPSTQLAMQPIDEDDLSANIASILQAERDGKRVDGIIWWAADIWYEAHGKLPPDSSRPDDLARIHLRYLDVIGKAVRTERDRGTTRPGDDGGTKRRP